MPSDDITATPHQTSTKGVTADAAERLYAALGPVHQELKRRHIPCLQVALISLELWDQRPQRSFPEYHTPAIEVWDRQGKPIAAVTVSLDLTHFYVTVPTEQDEPYVVPAEAPELVAAFIPGYDREAS
ncbi:hypothetical protein ACIA8R_05610 [Nonomuraea sp. NPDC051191]|uniref:hypothetical protein n=1 Tax=Nonomuraea sp. NPDC051191 TaxID=3364372 RepID=UPI0037AAFC06